MIKRYTQGELVGVVRALCVSAVSVHSDIHTVGVNILEHTQKHGDYTAAITLLNGLPRGQRVKALAYWFSKFSNGKLRFSQDENKAWVGKLSERSDADFDIAGAEAMDFADLTTEKDPESATVKAILKSLASKATNAEMFSGTEVPKVTPAARAFASRLLALAKSDPELIKLVA